MKVVVTYITGEALNLPWWRICKMTDKEIKDYNNNFYKRETVEFDMVENEQTGVYNRVD
jgi:hypothetical protein